MRKSMYILAATLVAAWLGASQAKATEAADAAVAWFKTQNRGETRFCEHFKIEYSVPDLSNKGKALQKTVKVLDYLATQGYLVSHDKQYQILNVTATYSPTDKLKRLAGRIENNCYFFAPSQYGSIVVRSETAHPQYKDQVSTVYVEYQRSSDEFWNAWWTGYGFADPKSGKRRFLVVKDAFTGKFAVKATDVFVGNDWESNNVPEGTAAITFNGPSIFQ